MSLDAALEDVLAELLATSVELAGVPDHAFAQRAELRGRLTDLRAVAAELRAGASTDRAALRDRLGRLQAELARRLDHRISSTAAAQTGRGGGVDPEYVHALNRQIDEGQGVAELRKEIRRLEALLAEP